MLAPEEYAPLMVQAESMDKKDVYSEKQDFVRGAENNLPLLSLANVESFWEHAKFKMQSMLTEVYGLFWLKLCKYPSHYIKNGKRDRDSVLVI